jgi:hypothetical protein
MTELEKTYKKIKANISEQLDAYMGEVKSALKSLPPGKFLSLSIGVKVNDLGDGEHAIKTTLSFVMQKIKAELSASVNERQEDLPGVEADAEVITPESLEAEAKAKGPAKEKKKTRRKDQHAGKAHGIRS